MNKNYLKFIFLLYFPDTWKVNRIPLELQQKSQTIFLETLWIAILLISFLFLFYLI